MVFCNVRVAMSNIYTERHWQYYFLCFQGSLSFFFFEKEEKANMYTKVESELDGDRMLVTPFLVHTVRT